MILQLRPLKAEGTPVAVLEDGQDRVDVPVQFTAFGCDPHALAESKKTFVFPHWVGVGDLEPHYLSFPLSPELREELQDLIDDTCLKKG
ncbi:hypothetical protein [Thermocatellispora tengchongensis]|uniref:hypothetical protein n=1 Tax=Thermocatellispora tengchongensis TaxID=1073253 RepID=UPI00362D31DD